MKRVGFFPPLLLDMVAVGEQTGQIGESLERAAARYDKELEKFSKLNIDYFQI